MHIRMSAPIILGSEPLVPCGVDRRHSNRGEGPGEDREFSIPLIQVACNKKTKKKEQRDDSFEDDHLVLLAAYWRPRAFDRA